MRPLQSLYTALLGSVLCLSAGCARRPTSEARNVCESPYYRHLAVQDPDSLDATDFAFLARHKKQCHDYQEAKTRSTDHESPVSSFFTQTMLVCMDLFIHLLFIH
jgi:hypothetical protein